MTFGCANVASRCVLSEQLHEGYALVLGIGRLQRQHRPELIHQNRVLIRWVSPRQTLGVIRDIICLSQYGFAFATMLDNQHVCSRHNSDGQIA